MRVPASVGSQRGATTDTESAFTEYVLPEIDVLYRVALSITGQAADAEDLVQDTLLRAYRAIDRFDGRHPRAWLLTILRNAQVNRVRRRRPSLLRDADDLDRRAATAADPARTPEEAVVDRRFEADVEAAYEGLPRRYREVVDLVDLAGLSYAQAAETLGIPQGTVMSRLHRGRKRIRRALAGNEPTVSDGPDDRPTHGGEP